MITIFIFETLVFFKIYKFVFKVIILFRFRVTQKVLKLPLFSSLSSFLHQVWTDWQKLFIEFSTFVKLDKCGRISRHWRSITCQIFILIWNFLCEIWPGICFRENYNGGSKQAYKWACKCFSWRNFNLIHGNQHLHQGRDFTKCYQCFS